MVPLVAVPGRLSPRAEGLRNEVVAVGQRYLRALRRAGAEGVVLLPDAGAVARLPEVLARVDGVLLPGGGDLDPARYGAAGRHPQVYAVDADHDAFDLAVARAAVAARLPMLAICRGLQVLNVALGGTLVQHLGDRPTGVAHRGHRHEVALVAGCRAAVAMGTTRPWGWSLHHQAVDRLAPGLAATGWAADGTVEAVELADGWVVGVQWHPEDSAGDDLAHQGLFDAFAEACRRARATPRP